MDKQLTTATDSQNAIIVPGDAVKDTKHRLARFADWLDNDGRRWYQLDLRAYRDHLKDAGYAASTVSAHLSTVRSRYADLARDRDRFYEIAAQQTDDPLLRKSIVDEMVTRIGNATDPAAAPVKQQTKQDVADAEHVRLTSRQASGLIAAPGVSTLAGLRDTAVIAVMLCTGVREAELVGLDVSDLRQQLGGELALQVREGKGAKQRLVPYGDLDWCLAIVDRWLAAAGISEGAAFRGFYKGNRRLRPGRLSVRQVQNILRKYPVTVNGNLVTVRPHDCRRTYARRLYDGGVPLVAIQQNLGHADVKTTLGYIGTLSADTRRAPAVYSFDLGKLADAPGDRLGLRL